MFCVSSEIGDVGPAREDQDTSDVRGSFHMGQTVDGRYLLHDGIGKGGMGRVFLAQDLRLQRPVAIKVLAHDGYSSEQLTALLEKEARLGASLVHDGIARVLDFGFHQDESYTVFEFLEGDTLRAVIRRRQRIPLAETQRMVSELAGALDFAHSRGIVHRDLKPENISLTQAGRPKILDLGLAQHFHLTRSPGVYSGTPEYSSPEQAECRHTDGRSDQYALGLIAYEMLTGTRPFTAPDRLGLLRQHATVPAPDPRLAVSDLPEQSASAILRTLAKRPESRFATCEQFASALRPHESATARLHLLSTPASDRVAFYLCHERDESLLALRIAEGLEARQFRCWYHARDTVPGVSTLSQALTAIERSEAVILLISQASIASRDFRQEIVHAHGTGCRILPILVDLSSEEFEKRNPPWRTILGVNPLVEVRRTDDIAQLVERFAASADVLKIVPGLSEPVIRLTTSRRPDGQKWATDANQIGIKDLSRVVYTNDIIREFFEQDQKYFLVGTKGLGKTLLLTRKRQVLTQEAGKKRSAATLIPAGRPYLDFMTELRSLSSRFQKPLSDLSTTKRLWGAALRISVISYHPAVADDLDFAGLVGFPARFCRWMAGERIEPTVVFKELTTLQVSELNRLIDQSENILDERMRRVHAATYIFIDKVDQAIRHLSREAWIHVQAGLIEAAWELMNANSHIKVYATIRQEAFSNYQSDTRSNLFGATSSLDYTVPELHTLLDQLSACYEGNATFSEFIGMNVIRHPRRAVPEDTFQFVRRHSLGRPRDLVVLASELSRRKASLSERELRQVVERTAASVIVPNIFSEVGAFLDCLDDEQTRIRFLRLVSASVLDRGEAVEICEVFNGLERGSLQHLNDVEAQIYHPFRDLYLAGLLGYVEEESDSGEQLQRFRQPGDSFSVSDVPNSPFYFMHPALSGVIHQLKSGDGFVRIQQIAIGDMLPWRPFDRLLLQVEKSLSRVESAEFRNAMHACLAEVTSLVESGNQHSIRARMELSDTWQGLFEHEGEDACAESLIWAEELIDFCGRH